MGIALGGAWGAARALVIVVSPPEKIRENYGLYNMGGKFGFILGPLVWGALVFLGEGLGTLKYRIALCSLLFFILGEGVKVHYVTSEIVEITDDGSQIVMKTEPDEFTAELTLSGYQCDDSITIRQAAETQRIKMQGKEGVIRTSKG